MGSKVPLFIVAIGIVFSIPILILSMIVAFGKHYQISESYWELVDRENTFPTYDYGVQSNDMRNLHPPKSPRPIKPIPLKPVDNPKDFDTDEEEEKPKGRKLQWQINFGYRFFKENIKDEINDGKLFTRAGFGVMMVDIVFLAATIFVYCGGTVPINKKITMCITSVIALAATIAGIVMFAIALHHCKDVQIAAEMRTDDFQYTKRLYKSVKSAKKMLIANVVLTALAIVIGLIAVLGICFMIDGSTDKTLDDQADTDMKEVQD